MPSQIPRISGLPPLACFLLVAASVAGCGRPSMIDEECIKGRLSKEQAAEINQGPWGHLPSYNRDGDGHCKNCAREGDRVLSATCSDFIKRL